jgi:hypothetical protein
MDVTFPALPEDVVKKLCWERMSRESIDRESFVELGLTCLVLKNDFNTEEKLLKHECLKEFNGIGDSIF